MNIAYLCDPEQIASLKARGEHVENLLGIYGDMLNTAISGRSPDMTISMHLCRGNFRSTWVASGGYEPVAEVLFNKINADAYFMEYDTDRAGGFEPLRFVPRGEKIVVLGLVTSKTGELESKDELKRRIDQAAKYLPLEQLALSPQCGFASTEQGNLLTEEQQWAKLQLCVDVARVRCGAGYPPYRARRRANQSAIWGQPARNAAIAGIAFIAASSSSLGSCGRSRSALTMQRKPSGSPPVARNWCQVQDGMVTRSCGPTSRTSSPSRQWPRPRRIITAWTCSWRSKVE